MTHADKPAFLEIVLGFAELRGKQLSAPALELYWRAMQHWEIGDFKQASLLLLRSCEFMPTPKDFEDLRKAGRPTPGEVWLRVLEAGRDRSHPVGLDAAAYRALHAIGGIDAIAFSETDKTHFIERRFIEFYETMRESDDVREELPMLVTDPQVKALIEKLK